MRIIERLTSAYIALVVTRPKTILLCFLLGTAALGWQARHFSVNASPETLLTKDNELYFQTRLANQRFPSREFLLIAYQPEAGPLLSAQTFSDLRRLTRELRDLERVASVTSLLNVPLFSFSDDLLSAQTDWSQLTLEHMLNGEGGEKPAAELDQELLQRLRRELENHPIYENLLINEQQTATAIQVSFKHNEQLQQLDNRILELQRRLRDQGSDPALEREIERLQEKTRPLERQLDATRAAEIRTIRRLFQPYEERANLYLGGAQVLAYQLINIISTDLLVFGSAVAAVICAVLLLLFRRLRWVAIPALCCVCSLLSTMGLFGMLGIATTVISSNFIALQLILTLALVIHLIVQYRETSAAEPQLPQTERVRKAMQAKIQPVFFAGLTTSVGFGSLIFSGLQPVISFGWMMIIAMFFSIIVSLVLFPSVLTLFDREPEHALRRRPLATATLRLFIRLSRHRLLAGIASAGVIALSAVGILRLDVENSFINYFKSSTEVHRELSFIDRQFGGSTPLDLLYEIQRQPQNPDLLMSAATVQKLQRIQQRLEQYPASGKVLSVVNFTELAKKLNEGKPLTEYELTAVYWLLEKPLREEFLGAFLAPEANAVKFNMRVQDTTEGLDRAGFLENIRNDMQALNVDPQHYKLTNLFVLYQDILQRLYTSQILTLGIVYGALVLVFLLIFRSLRVAAIAIVPNILSTLAVLGAMGLLSIPLDIMTITIAAIAVGIAVDNTIHYTHRYLERLRDHSAEEAVERSHLSVGFAALYTTLIITIGFSLLAFSDFVPSVLFGLLTGLTMLIALVADLWVLPALLSRFVKPVKTPQRDL